MTGVSEGKFDEKLIGFISFLKQHAIHARDPSELLEKMIEIQEAGHDNFQVVSDFDRTLTPQWLRDPCSKSGALVSCQSSHGVIETSPLASPAYAKHTRELAEYYMPLEHSIQLSREEKTKICEEWYHKAHTCMMDEKITASTLDKIVEHCWSAMKIHLRSNCNSFLKLTSDIGVPVTVLSAGLANVIERILKQETRTIPENIMIVGNLMTFDELGNHTGFSEPVIHALNKRHALTEALVENQTRAVRKNALVMGDLIGDVDFVHSVPHLSQYIAIGFLSDGPNHDERLNEYLKHFDLVITGGSASMDVAIELLKALFVPP
jgi:HAD superfamily hydrolase (TIGR01544 family)